VQANHQRRKANGTHQLLVYADDVNTLGENINTINKNTDALLEASNEPGLEAKAEKTNVCVCLATKCRTKS
jgi:hypothetical protein